jgi:hypothetical protein
MSSHIDFRTLPANVPVLCIPRVYPNINESRIRKIFDELKMGELERIDVVSKTSERGEKFNRVFVHFRRWNNSDNSNNARERLLNGKEIKIIYDDPWFWKISAYREPERRQVAAPHKHRKPVIAFDDSDDEKKTKPFKPKPSTKPPNVNHSRRPVRKFVETRTPSNSPPRRRMEKAENEHPLQPPTTDEDATANNSFLAPLQVPIKEEPPIDYGEYRLPPVKKRQPMIKKEVVEEADEEGLASEEE